MWEKEVSKLELADSMVWQVMPDLSAQKNDIILCDIWHAKKDLVCVVDDILGGTLRSVTMRRKHSGHYAVTWSAAAKGLRCWST